MPDAMQFRDSGLRVLPAGTYRAARPGNRSRARSSEATLRRVSDLQIAGFGNWELSWSTGNADAAASMTTSPARLKAR
jgi:hypothetical protein